MKKPTVILLSALLLCTCSCNNQSSENKKSISDDSNNSAEVDYETVFSSVSDLVQYINKNASEESIDEMINHATQDAAENGFYIFQPTDIAEEYKYSQIKLAGPYVSYRYWTQELQDAKDNKESTHYLETTDSIAYAWYYQGEGETVLQNFIESRSLAKIADADGYYNTTSGDIYWCQDGYMFVYYISREGRANDDLNYNYTADDIPKMQKTFYKFE